ncbi:hypothetical protein LPJ75_001632 [Coemansia sp. RSA 2598]|nr:hypothetical protein LPJ75_001632 [Coemansia sp. RSA 2598]
MSQRVVNMSMAAETSGIQPQQQQPTAGGDARGISKRKTADAAESGAKKHVQFNIPDDVRFRWLDIFHQPSDPETSDREEDKGPSEVPKSPELPPTPPDSALPTASAVAPEPAPKHPDPPVPHSASLSSSIDAMPFTANSSVEAVYGGSRTEATEPSAAQSRTHLASLAKPGGSGVLDEDRARSRLQRILNAAGSEDRRSGGKEAAEPTARATEADASGSRFATVSGKTNRQRIAARLAQENMILGAQRSTPSTAPSLATTKVTVPKRYSVSPPFTAPQMDSATGGIKEKHSKPAASDDSSAPVVLPAMHRSESAQSTGSFELLTASMRRRRNSHDGSSSSLRRRDSSSVENYPLSAINGAPVSDTSGAEDSDKQRQEHQGGGRLLRRVTTTAAHYRGSRPQGDDPIGGIIGGTRDFFKNRLRSRTHSTSNNEANGNVDGTDKQTALAHDQDRPSSKGSATEYHMNTLSGVGNAEAQERARRRSDAEVKSRLPPLPLTLSSATGLQAQFAGKPQKQQRRALASEMRAAPSGRDASKAPAKTDGGNAAADLAKVALQQPLLPADRRGESGRAPHPEAVRGQRKSHDDVLPMHLSKKADADQAGQRNGRHAVQTRTSSAEYARKQPQQASRRLFAAPLESTMKLTKAQIELLRLRPANSGDRRSAETQRQSPAAKADAAFPSLGANDDDNEAYSQPPLPKMPPLPPIPPQAAQSPLSSQRPQAASADKKSSAGDTDSIDYHLRRLKSDKKTRRSSFMTTLSNMLGRKE